MKIKNFTALVCMLFVAQLSFGQITLERSYEKGITSIQKQYGDLIDCKYFHSDEDTGTITIYNLDNSVYKTINIDIPTGSSMNKASHLYVYAVNSDPLIELYYTLISKDSKNNTVYTTFLINENGELIKKIDEASSVSVTATETGMKLMAYINIYANGNYIYKTDIYSLPTTLNSIPSQQSESASFPYPNPAKQTITIPYQLSGQWGTIFIYNASGQFVEQKNVDKNFSNLLLDVSGYAKGMYYYKVDKLKGEFMVN